MTRKGFLTEIFETWDSVPLWDVGNIWKEGGMGTEVGTIQKIRE
jgi:hypothetical protein